MFLRVMDVFFRKRKFNKSSEKWCRKPYKRYELERLCRIEVEMSPEEVSRRVRSTFFQGKPGPYIELHGKIFSFDPWRLGDQE
jgi:hypothetical protein